MNWRKLKLWGGVVSLLILSVLGFQGLWDQLRSVDTLGRTVSTAAQIAYVVLGVIAAAALIRKPRWSRGLLYAWAAALTLTGATAPIVWGEQGWIGGVIAAVITALLAKLILWLTAKQAGGEPA
ncbi:MAG TPA: hypothetical protein VLG68_01070 [Gammaproteobacteria bacterium]|nr:hypothetical protein [Gammaproteobacteria bacterium]